MPTPRHPQPRDNGSRREKPRLSTPEEGFELVNVRSEWKGEALNFTPWLAENLHLLGKALGLNLEHCRTEAPVGPFSLDILAREIDKDVKVAIENQLAETDHGHLGQLLTYATGYNAHIAIWVASDFVYEHAEALHRLNELTGEGIKFYGVKIEVIQKVGDACRERRFRKVVYPGGWDKEHTLEKWERPPRIQQYYDFFQPLVDELLRTGFANGFRRRHDHADRLFPSGLHRYTGYMASFYKDRAWASLHVETGDKDLTNRIFDALKEQKKSIESCFEAETDWDWNRNGSQMFSSINIRRDGSIDDPQEKLEEIRAWMLDRLPKLKEVLDPHLKRVLKELQPEGADGAEG